MSAVTPPSATLPGAAAAHAPAGARAASPRMTVRRTLALIASDYRRMADHYRFPLTVGRAVGITILPAMYGLIIHRISHLCHERGLRFIAWPLYSLNIMLTGLDIVPSTVIGERCLLGHTVGSMVSGRIGRNATLLAKVGIGGGRGPGGPGNERGLPVLGDDVTVGANATVMGPITVGDGAIVGAHSLVLHDVAPLAVVTGVPARVLRYRASAGDPAL